MKYLLPFLLLGIVAPASAREVWLSHDVKLEIRPGTVAKSQPSSGRSCRDRIAGLMCLVEPMHPGEVFQDRTCLPTPPEYAAPFLAHYDRSSPLIQEMYCHLETIYVEKEFFGTAYATWITDGQGAVKAGAIGIREEVLRNPPDLYRWLSWKEETSFGGDLHTGGPLRGIVSYAGNGAASELFFDHVITHEFGHLFDLAAGLNHFDDCRYERQADGHWERVGTCVPAAGSWAELTWAAGPAMSPRPEADFPLRQGLCFYGCEGRFLPASEAGPLFGQLLASPFVSTYAATNPLDDFAETFAYMVLHAEKAVRWTVSAGGQVFDLSEHFGSDRLAQKRAYITAWRAGGVRYPGPGTTVQMIDLNGKTNN